MKFFLHESRMASTRLDGRMPTEHGKTTPREMQHVEQLPPKMWEKMQREAFQFQQLVQKGSKDEREAWIRDRRVVTKNILSSAYFP